MVRITINAQSQVLQFYRNLLDYNARRRTKFKRFKLARGQINALIDRVFDCMQDPTTWTKTNIDLPQWRGYEKAYIKKCKWYIGYLNEKSEDGSMYQRIYFACHENNMDKKGYNHTNTPQYISATSTPTRDLNDNKKRFEQIISETINNYLRNNLLIA